ncbi:glycosyltransferase family 1 [Lecanosticta acicola]|uniref:UDP-N-acetylglucosamine transferase subunit ALG14 n=1 Tax=Lecanosticta acicola TaxID=111012 RepID=A0AAI8Z5Y8_9PEZI|nr:glycosyltransferase family 1 [Lecanosticta acicola]
MNLITALARLTTTLLVLCTLTLYRLSTILSPNRPKPNRTRGKNTHLLIVLGSGGHTAEMFAMLQKAYGQKGWEDFCRRTWVVSSGDTISAARAKEWEENRNVGGQWEVRIVERARKIHQPLWTAPISCMRCAWGCVGILRAAYPDVILCNGPATATILVFTSLVLKFLGLGEGEGKMRTVYVESWARVKKASLSGMLLSWVAGRFVVQWEQMESVLGRKTEFGGVLVG